MRKYLLVLLLLTTAAVKVSEAQTLSQNSGINANDTYAVFNITIQGQGTATFRNAIFNP
jgi:hypothetical protein